MLKKVSSFNLEDLDNFSMDQHPVALTFVNLLIQKIMRQGSLQQVGKAPRFFNPAEKLTINDRDLGNLDVLCGYKASSYIYNSGCFIVLENINKFVRKESVLDKIQELIQERYNQQEIDEYFSERMIMTTWGNNRMYRVTRIRMDLDPLTTFFSLDDEDISLKDYFRIKYQKDLIVSQPILEVASRKEQIFLPSQCCYIENIPEALSNNKKLISKFRKNP